MLSPTFRVVSAATLLLVALFAVGCGGGGSHTQLRIMQASPGTPNVDVEVDGKTVASDIAYSSTTGYLTVDSGSRHVQIFQTGTTTGALIDQTINLGSGTSSTYLISNFSSALDFTGFTDDNTAPDTGNFKLRVINASPTLGPVDVYVVTPGTNISTVSPTFTNLQFNTASIYLNQVAAAEEIFFTSPGTKFVRIDTSTLNFAAGQIRTLVALDDTSGGFTFTTLSDLN